MPPPNPISPFLEHAGALILDGGLASELEARGADLTDDLWSARLLLDDPARLREVHLAYLAAGADCIASASYQATVPGLRRRGLDPAQAVATLRGSVEIARRARDDFWAGGGAVAGRLRPLVAASIGPYGAFLADGSEYRGDDGLSVEELADFHRPRWQTLATSGADLLACETIPSRREARALVALLRETPEVWAWVSFSCRDGRRLSDGSDLAETVAELAGEARLAAVGVNCVPPRLVPELLAAARPAAAGKPLAVYPNSGEGWDPAAKRWLAADAPVDLAAGAVAWHAAGARLIGGCCRTRPADVAALRARLTAALRSGAAAEGG